MHHPVSQGAHEIPGNIQMEFFKFLRDVIGRFPDNDEVHFHSANGAIIITEGLIVHALRELLNFGNRSKDIADTLLNFPS